MTNDRDPFATPWQDEAPSIPAVRPGVTRERGSNASRRDDTARRREERALHMEEGIVASSAPIRVRFAQLRELAALDRARAKSERRHAVAARAAAFAARSRLEAEVHGAHRGDLTGTFRREAGWHALILEIDRSRRGDGRFVLAFLDIEDLRAITDRAGRGAGDLVLSTLVATLRSSLRSFDPIVRFGGDQFVCGFGGVDEGEVERRLVGAQRSLYLDTGAWFSFGLAVLAAGETLEALTARADAALLDAKGSRPD